MTCSKCGEQFNLLPGKPGLANVCPKCTEMSPEERAKKLAEAKRHAAERRAADRKNTRRREEARELDLHLESLGFERVPGKRFTVEVPKGRE